MAEATITINLSKEDRELLQAVSTGLVDLIAVLTAKAETPAQTPQEWHQVAAQSPWEGQEAGKPDEPKKEPAKATAAPQTAATEPTKPTISLDDIRKKVTQLRANGTPKQKAESANIIKRRSANISGLPADTWNEVWAELIALEQSEG